MAKEGFQQYVNRELPDVQAGFIKAEEQEIKQPIHIGLQKKHGFPESSVVKESACNM